jgi:hypothetical protein
MARLSSLLCNITVRNGSLHFCLSLGIVFTNTVLVVYYRDYGVLSLVTN